MSLPVEATPKARSEDLLITEKGDELVIYDLKRFKIHNLNSTSVLVWKACDGSRTVPEIVAFLGNQSGTEIDERVVWYTLKRLQGAYLFAESLELPAQAGRITRRDLIAVAGLAGIVALPVITSIIAPTPAQAQSAPGSGEPTPPPPGQPGPLPPGSGSPTPPPPGSGSPTPPPP
ncbi:MAG TPA: PqqD family protein, partial [Blastocatellia bacterium]|nr:PqqD family protein [Blastocatellia bacterium]